MIGKLEPLWKCLGMPEQITKFRNLATIYKQSSLEEIENELKRCKALKQENIKLFVDKLRIQIVAAWDKIYRSESERNKFTYFQSDVYTEDLLELHEMELEECNNFYEANRWVDNICIRIDWLQLNLLCFSALQCDLRKVCRTQHMVGKVGGPWK